MKRLFLDDVREVGMVYNRDIEHEFDVVENSTPILRAIYKQTAFPGL